MDITAKTLVFILISIVAVYILGFLPRLVCTLRRRIMVLSMRSNRRRNALVESFLTEEHPGKFFVAMIGAGLLRSIKTINHGADFPDDKQLDTFKRYGTPVIKDALEQIGESV